MTFFKLLLALIAIVGFLAHTANASGSCAVCAGIVGALETKLQLKEHHHHHDHHWWRRELGMVDKFCELFPEGLKPQCERFVGNVNPIKLFEAMKMILQNHRPERVCNKLGMCVGSDEKCVMYKEWPLKVIPAAPKYDPKDEETKPEKRLLIEEIEKEEENIRRFLKDDGSLSGIIKKAEKDADEGWNSGFLHLLMDFFAVEKNPCGKDPNCDYDRFIQKHLPLDDDDEDGFSQGKKSNIGDAFRGAHWRGRDCDDTNGDIRPGRVTPVSNDYNVDHNCNGISGVDTTGASYEEKFCKDTPPRGMAIIGDSATAHFHLPPELLNPHTLGLRATNNLVEKGADELDVPQCSWSTGHSQYCPPSSKAIKSIYERMYERNRCMHRDFQNIGVNGQKMVHLIRMQDTLTRDQQNDAPITLFVAYVGNDICNGHTPTLPHMTSTSSYAYFMKTGLAKLDKKLPKGSHVVFIPVLDGRFLYEGVKNELHPSGAPYKDFYAFMTCNESNPCNPWMNTNTTIQDMAYQRVTEYKKVMIDIVKNEGAKMKNFETVFIDLEITDVLAAYKKDFPNGKLMELIEPSDGFHPNQMGQAYFADRIWELLEKEAPAALGQINPHNDEIEKIFGFQGGY
eukprot:TRINITY_DN47_c1_g2_i1.p1 TRINITY_DN47_c1_g2~~TRINITY_DN47_c1_g2_i1.p1  ORF type:complete len:624 (-),score=229.24 TRINITY_DN47_c1_g2_i1:149-2020(-)